MKPVLFLIGICFFVIGCSVSERKSELSAKDFQFSNYNEIAISTDLEPDDVLALAILFEEANRLYKHSSKNKYPIDLIVIGEGDTKKKHAMMRDLLQEHFDLPDGISITIIESNEANRALTSWAAQANNPFILQLKPAQELLYFDDEAACKTTVLFYGGYNIRQTVLDSQIRNDQRFEFIQRPTFPAQLEGLMSYLSDRFSKIAVLETFGTLGDQPCVCSECAWTQKISEIIATPNDRFVEMFHEFSSNWNRYILEQFLKERPDGLAYKDLRRRIINSDVQFTLADVLVAIATTNNSNLFQATPIKATYDENGFLIPVADPRSNVVYYGEVNREKVANLIEGFLHSKTRKTP
jgi:hypothetical protein